MKSDLSACYYCPACIWIQVHNQYKKAKASILQSHKSWSNFPGAPWLPVVIYYLTVNTIGASDWMGELTVIGFSSAYVSSFTLLSSHNEMSIVDKYIRLKRQ